MKKYFQIGISIVIGAILGTALFASAAPILQPGRGSLLAPLNLNNLIITAASPFTVAGSSSSTITGDGTTSTIGSALTVNGSLKVVGNVQFTGSSTIITPVIGGAITGDACDSATSSIDSTITSSTASFVPTPINDPGPLSLNIYSLVTAPGVLTTRVCSAITITPSSTAYIVKIIK